MWETQLSLVLYYEIALYCGILILESRPHTQSIHLKNSLILPRGVWLLSG